MCYCIKTVHSQTGEMSGKDFFSLERTSMISYHSEEKKRNRLDYVLLFTGDKKNLKIPNQILGRKALCVLSNLRYRN